MSHPIESRNSLLTHSLSDGAVENVDDDSYILFNLGEERYGTKLLSVREIVQPQPYSRIPNTVADFLGVVNLRGQVVGVVDLRMRFGIVPRHSESMALLVFDTDNGPLAALVDQVVAVAHIPHQQIDGGSMIKSHAAAHFMLGIGKHGADLVTLIDVNKVLATQDIVAALPTASRSGPCL